MAAIAANRTELLQIADAVARDKSIDKSVVLHAMEEAMQRAAKARYGSENEIRVDIDPKTGELIGRRDFSAGKVDEPLCPHISGGVSFNASPIAPPILRSDSCISGHFAASFCENLAIDSADLRASL